MVVHGAYQVYQFFVHTRFIPALGPLERRARDAGPAPRAPRPRRRLPRQELRRLLHRLGQAVRQLRALHARAGLRRHRRHPQLEPVLGEPAPVRRARPPRPPRAQLGAPPSRSGSARPSGGPPWDGARRRRRPATGSRCRRPPRCTRWSSSASRWRRRSALLWPGVVTDRRDPVRARGRFVLSSLATVAAYWDRPRLGAARGGVSPRHADAGGGIALGALRRDHRRRPRGGGRRLRAVAARAMPRGSTLAQLARLRAIAG